MKKLLFSLIISGVTTGMLHAQQKLHGKVADSGTGDPLFGVNVYLPEQKTGTTTDEDGAFEIEKPPVGAKIQFSYVGYAIATKIYKGEDNLKISLLPSGSLEEIVIKSVRASDLAPVAQVTIDREKIEKIHVGQDVEFMLESMTPSLISYSESGTNFSNYGQFRLRGIDQSRVNITLNGAPLNDMIDQGVFFSNFTDFSNSIQSVQVQRGVGTSANGTASFAGSINFESVNLMDEKPSGEVELVGGSFGTYRGSLAAKTGLMKNKMAFYSRFSTFHSDGYRYNTSTDSYSFYASGGYFGEKDLLKFTAFIGRSKNGLAYSPVAISDIRNDPRTNYLNENDVDDFGQWFAQLHHTHLFNANTSLVSSVYYGGAGGDFPYTYTDNNGDLAQINYPLFNDHIGIMSNINRTSKDNKFSLSAGIHAYTFLRRNEESDMPDKKNPYYVEHSRKDEFSAYAKAEYLLGKLRLFGDLQFRTLKLSINPDNTLLPDEDIITKNWSFLNPRIGMTFEMNEKQQFYASYGYTGREPTKIDLFGGFSLNPSNLPSVKSDDVRPEYVNDVEAGLLFRYPDFHGQLNFFYMMFRDEIAPIGAYVPEGFLQLRKNIPSSFRRGIELDFNWNILKDLVFTGDFTYMDSRIKEYKPEEDPNVYENVKPALSPEVITQGALSYQALSWLGVSLSGRYVSSSYQEPTNDARFVMPSFFVANMGVSFKFGKTHSFDVYFNNIFDKQYFTYGAPVDQDWDGNFDEPGYFVQPPRNLYGKLVLRF